MNQNYNLKYQLDANGGLVINQEDLQYFINIESNINNINGWSQDKINIRNEYVLIRNKLLQTFVNNDNEPQFQNIYYSFSVSDAIKSLSNAVSNKNESIYLYPNHHPRIQQIFKQQIFTQTSTLIPTYHKNKLQKNKSQKVCLINLLTSQFNIDQSDQIYDAEKQNFLYTIVDASQALGRLNLQSHLEHIDCLLISPRKVGGMSNLCFIFTTRQFDQKYISIDGTDNNQSYFLPETRFISYVLASARPVIDNFSAQFYDEEQNKLQYDTLVQQLSYFKDDIHVQDINNQNINNQDSDIQSVHNQDVYKQEDTNNQDTNIQNNNTTNIKHTYTSVIIELEKPLCPKLFQQELDKMGISVGFETSCQSNTSNKLRLSWRYIYPNINIINQVEQALQACKEDVQNNDNINNDNINNSNNNTLIGGYYKLKIQQDKQYDTKQGWQNLNQFNKHLFYLRGHWVPLNTDDNDTQRLKIPSKYIAMFQNFVLQQRQDYYLYIPELKEEFESWCEEKENQNYKLENIHALTYDDVQNHKDLQNVQYDKQDDKDNKNSFQESLTEFEYLYRVSKHIYLTPFPTDELNQKTILTISDFEFDEKEKRYPKLPNDFIQLFENTVSTDKKDDNDNKNTGNNKNILYPMTYTKYKECLKQNIDLQEEYINNPSSEFIIKLKLPIQEHYINESNSYKNIIKKQSLVKQTPGQSVNKQSIDKQSIDKQYPNQNNDINIDEIDTNYIQVIQPYKSYMNENVIEKTKEIIKRNSKTKIILILHNPSIEQQDEIFKLGFEEVRNKILSYQNWFQQWYFDDNIYTYIKNVKKTV